MTTRLLALLLGAAGALVPSVRRREWREEWEGELTALAAARARGVSGVPTPLSFVAGAFPHALWMRTEGWTMDSVLQDLRYSARVLRRAPAFTIVAVLTLALGIGANATIFSLVNGLVLRTPPGIQEPEALVQIGRSFEQAPRWDSFSWPAMRMIAEEAEALDAVAGYAGQVFVLGQGADTERILGHLVTGNYFELLGVTPEVGRLLQPADDVRPGGHPVLVLSHDLWTRRFGADPDVVGRTVLVGNRPYEIVGVTPRGFAGVESVGFRPEVYAPVMMSPELGEAGPFETWGWSWLNLVGRRKAGTSFQEARTSMDVVAARLREANPVHEGILVPLVDGIGLDPEGRIQARRLSAILGVIVVLVLLLTCTNVANLFLSRASGRATEVGVRMALGAGRGRLLRQLGTESLLLALGAVLVAAPLVARAGDLLPLVVPYGLAVSLAPDARVYAFLAGVGLVAGVLLMVAPALAATRKDAAVSLREGASTRRRSGTRLQDGLVVAQLALSLGLVTGAALLGRSVLNARSADPGFDPTGLTAGFVDLYATGRYDEERGRVFFRELLADARNLPGVTAATLVNQTPLAGGQSRSSVQPVDRDEVTFEAEYNVVGPDYFTTLQIPVLEGRALNGFGEEPERVVVVNETLAALFWPGESAVGKELRGEPAWRVVGVVGDVQTRSLRSRPRPAVYYPMDRNYLPRMAVVLAAPAPESRSEVVVRQVVADLDPALPVSRVYDLEQAMIGSMAETRTVAWLITAFAGLALLLAAIGLYGLVAYGAAQRVREFGIRVALGAEPRSLVRLVLGRGLSISMAGIALGALVALGLGRALGSLLFGVSPTSVPTFLGAALVLLATAVVASLVPARRASRVDAAVSLRE